MANESDSTMHDYHDKKASKHHGGSGIAGGIYFMAFIGAAVYYISQTETFWAGVLGFLKAIVWPAMLTYHLFKFLGM